MWIACVGLSIAFQEPSSEAIAAGGGKLSGGVLGSCFELRFKVLGCLKPWNYSSIPGFAFLVILWPFSRSFKGLFFFEASQANPSILPTYSLVPSH